MPTPFTVWHAAQCPAWYTTAPRTAKSGASASALEFSGVSLSRKAASEFNCASPSATGGMALPGRTAAGCLKWRIIQAASLWTAVGGRSGPTDEPAEGQLAQLSGVE